MGRRVFVLQPVALVVPVDAPAPAGAAAASSSTVSLPPAPAPELSAELFRPCQHCVSQLVAAGHSVLRVLVMQQPHSARLLDQTWPLPATSDAPGLLPLTEPSADEAQGTGAGSADRHGCSTSTS